MKTLLNLSKALLIFPLNELLYSTAVLRFELDNANIFLQEAKCNAEANSIIKTIQ